MHKSFFGLARNPFQLTPDPEFLFPSKGHKKALTYLNYGISTNTGFILITGEVGTGKTTIIRKILKGLGKDIKVARVNNTLVTSEQLISMINDDFGIETQGKDKTRMLRDLTDFIINQYAQGYRTTLIIDEAQNLSSALLEEIRLLSNLETDKSKLLQIILVGQPELKHALAVPQLRQLRQRISISCHINPLERDETEEYIMHRLDIAGNRNAVYFLEGAMDALHSSARGIPRLINIFCDFLLLAAFTEGTKEISVDLVKEIAMDIDSENRYWKDAEQEDVQDSEPKILKSILTRLEVIESAMQSRSVSRTELEELAAKVKTLENTISIAVENLSPQADAPSNGKQLRAILREVEYLKARNSELEQMLLSSSRSEDPDDQKKKAPWARFFS
jgi:general secretion pathway protein A